MTLDLDITFIIVLALFLLPLAILNGLVIGPFMKLFEERHERLEGAIARAEEMLEEAERRSTTFEEQIRKATQKGLEARASIRAEATATMNARVAEERKKVQAKLDAALVTIEKERVQAMEKIGAEAEAIADLTADKLLGRAAA